MLARYAGGALELPRPAAEEVIVRCGGLPLALATCGAMASGGYPWASIVTLLREADLGALQVAFRDYPHPSLLAAIAVGANALDEHSLSLYSNWPSSARAGLCQLQRPLACGRRTGWMRTARYGRLSFWRTGPC